MNGNEQYLRAARLTLAKPLPNAFFKTNPLNAVLITDLRIKFKIVKSLKPEPNKAEFTVFNLNASSRAEFAKLPMYVRLDAGYGQHLERVFEGDVRFAFSTHVDTEWETNVESGDGDRSFRFAQVSRSFGKGTDARTMVKELAKTMGLKMPANVADAKALAKKFASGASLTGDSRIEMSKLLKSQGLGWSVQDGRLQILGSEPLEGTALVLTEESGS